MMNNVRSKHSAPCRPRALLVLFMLLVGGPAGAAQAPTSSGRGASPGGGPPVPRVVSPEVLPDRRVIVRLYAPQAREVSIQFEQGGHSMTRGENGVWQGTVGPLDPGSYRYGFAPRLFRK